MFNAEFQNSINPGNFQKIPGIQDIALELSLDFLPGIFWKFPGLMEFWNSALNIKFLDKKWVEKIPYILKLGKSSQFQGDIQSSRKYLEVSRNDKILKFRIENQVPWLKMSEKDTLYVEIS